MAITYSTYEAKTRFYEVIRRVREGCTVTVSYRGEPVAEIRPIRQTAQTIEERLDELERRGALERAKGPRVPVKLGEHRDGVLDRFLSERGE